MNIELTPAKEVVICQTCGKKFVAWKNYHRQFCSRQCSGKDPIRIKRAKILGNKNVKPKIKRICQYCGKEFSFAPCYLEVKGFKGIFCSTTCYAKSRIGNKSPGHSKRLLGRKRPKHSQKMRGSGNSNWKGGIARLPYSYEFNENLKEQIRKRDNYTCQLCGKLQKDELNQYNRKLSIHHIDYDKKNCKKSNLISLCNKCNSVVNFTRKQWIKYFKEKLIKK